jgi:zinc transport system substrate-binding protein
VTVNYPLHYFAQRIGGDLIQLEYPIPEDVDPAYWVPDEKALEVHQSADIIFTNGADYAKWMHNVSLPSSRIVNTSKAFENEYIELQEVATHSHGPEGKHEHTGYAFTTWLDFELAIAQTKTIKNALIHKLPNEENKLEENFNFLKADLMGLHERMIQLAKEAGDQHFIGPHPVYQYLTTAYGIPIHSVHFESGEMPSNKQWKEIPHLMGHYPVDVMIWEGDHLPGIKEKLNEYKLKVAVFNPCGNKPEKGNLM